MDHSDPANHVTASLASASQDSHAIERRIKVCVIAAVALFVLGVAALAYGAYKYWPLGSSTLNLLGDYAGGVVGTIWTLATLLLIYVAFLGQRIQIAQQQRELELTKQQFMIQQFENTLMALIGLHHEIVGSLGEPADSVAQQGIARGRDYFDTALSALRREYGQLRDSRADSKDLATGAYDVIYKRFQAGLGHYFRNLYNIVKLIDQAPPEVDHRKYMNLLRAQLSSNESLLLFYNCLHGKGSKRFQPLVVKHGLLESVPFEDLLLSDHVRFYPLEAYGDRQRD